MHEEISRALQAGGTLVTINRRLARSYMREFHAQQQRLGGSVWNAPDILPLDAFLERAWKNWLWRNASGGLVLLDTWQEQIVWEQVIRESPAGETLLRIPETARLARDTWRLIQAYRLPVPKGFEATEDCSAFASWAHDFEKRCQARRWLESACLGDFVSARLIASEMPRPQALYAAGFEELTPQQEDLFAALDGPIRIEAPHSTARINQLRFQDADLEIQAAALRARTWIEQDGETKIGIIVPDLARARTKIERIFKRVLDPSSSLADAEASFHMSLGAPLGTISMIHAALLVLELGLHGLALPAAGMLLRSPFLGGFHAEASRRSLVDARLRRDGFWTLTTALLAREARECPVLQRNLARFAKIAQALPGAQRASEWSRHFAQLLEAVGWPGDRALNSREFQLQRAWHDCLSALASLDIALRHISFGEALSRLREIAASQVFQVENEGAPIQIMGALEASGLCFDHLWIMGLHDEALPLPAAPNPFLPLSLQREHKLPHSSADRELEFATKLIARLLAASPDVVVSYPASDGDRALSPSPLFKAAWESAHGEPTPAQNGATQMRSTARFQELADEMASPVAGGSEQRGGASLFKDMAACPFRAFARHRLLARPLEETTPGLSYKDRGITVHRALQIVWSELRSHERLTELDSAELEAVISRAAMAAVEAIPHTLGGRLEQRRLEKLLSNWLEIEKSRAPFTVHAAEIEREVSIGGLQIKTRADRIDELASGGDIIVDYKTGQLRSTAWDSERPAEPQVPLYCATSERAIAGAAIAQLRAGDLCFQGVMESTAALPMKTMRFVQPLPFAKQVTRWRVVLEQLAENFRAGRAEVDPKEGACENCGLWALCRIRDLR
ncbi:MAG TPA: PD-(D/E)XK nuclease family protein [Bryobacteraceae bacterium]|nr:PD-(D/E)XK nuclease family protein [Bryobacteraceae bacterium]